MCLFVRITCFSLTLFLILNDICTHDGTSTEGEFLSFFLYFLLFKHIFVYSDIVNIRRGVAFAENLQQFA